LFLGRERIFATFESDARATAGLIANTVINDVYFLDLLSLRYRLESARLNPDISYTYVMDPSGLVLADGTSSNPLRGQRFTDPFVEQIVRVDGWISTKDGEFLRVGGPIYMPDGSRIGHLYVGFSLRRPYELIGESVRASLYVTVLCFIGALILALWEASSFSRPVLSIARASKEIGEGRLDVRLSVDRGDELGTLAASINRMAESLQTRNAEIERANRSLLENEQRLRLLLETTSAIPWEADAKTWQFTYVGPQAVELLGYPADCWYERDFWVSHIHPDDREYAVEFCLKSSSSLMEYQFEYRMIAADRSAVWIHDTVSVVAKNGAPAILRGFMLNITERKRAESELQHHREELAHVTRVSTMGELATSLAHELNQPLGAILSNAEAAGLFLQADPPALNEVRDILADICKDDQRASEIIRGMRSLLRKQKLARQSLDINKAVEEVLKLLRIDAATRKVAMKFERTEDLPPVWGDRVHLQQVLLNLVLNGMEALAGVPEEGRQLVVRIGPGDDGTVKIAVSDSGPGIPADKLPKLFEPFLTTKKEGMGMGLSIARTIVESHQGQIWAENNSGVGATFYVTLPVSKEDSA
jgi:PAS domain S-box-containing protein